MYIFRSFICAVALPSALLANASTTRRSRMTKLLTLHGTNDGDLGANDSNAQTYREATLHRRAEESNEWKVIGGWYPYDFAIARQLDDRQTWVQEVENDNEAGTLIAAGFDDETPPGWWVIIGEGVDADRWSD